MRRATHYGVTADKQEVEHLRSEVTRLRSHIGDMGDKIGQLTSLVEALAVEGKPSAPAATRAAAAAAALSSSRRVELGEWRGLGQVDSGDDGFCGGVLGEGCSFREYGVGEEEEDSKFFPPAVAVGGGGAAGVVYEAADPATADAAFLPSRLLSRKRKLVGLDGARIIAEETEEGQDDKTAESAAAAAAAASASVWPSGVVAAANTVVKQETTSKIKHEIGLVKQEVVEESVSEAAAAAAASRWPLSADEPWASVDCRRPLGVVDATAPSIGGAAEITAVAAVAAATATAAASGSTPASAPSPPQPLVVEGSSVPGGEFLQGFTDQFLSFESPTSSYMLTDRSGGGVGGGGGDGGRASGGGAVSAFASLNKQDSCRGGSVDLSDGRVVVGYLEEDESHIDICGHGVPLTSGREMVGPARAAAAVAVVPSAVVAPLARSDVAVGAVARVGAISPLPPDVEELQDNLECLPPHSRTKVRGVFLACAHTHTHDTRFFAEVYRVVFRFFVFMLYFWNINVDVVCDESLIVSISKHHTYVYDVDLILEEPPDEVHPIGTDVLG